MYQTFPTILCYNLQHEHPLSLENVLQGITYEKYLLFSHIVEVGDNGKQAFLLGWPQFNFIGLL